MRPAELETGTILTASFEYMSFDADSLGILRENEGSLLAFSPDFDGNTILITLKSGKTLTVVAQDRNSRLMAERLLTFKQSALVWLLKVTDSNLLIQAHIFTSSINFSQDNPLQIIFSDEVINYIPKRRQDNPAEFFRQEFLLEGKAFAVDYHERKNRYIRLLGAEFFCNMEFGPQERCEIKKLSRHQRRDFKDPVTLLTGEIVFKDSTFKNVQGTLSFAKLSEVLHRSESYLKQWEVYNELEITLRQEEAAQIACMPYSSYRVDTKEGNIQYIFELEDIIPRELKDNGSHQLEAAEEPYTRDETSGKIKFPDKRIYVGELTNFDGRKKQLWVRGDSEENYKNPPKKGYLMQATSGDEVSITRRKRALNRVIQSDTPLLMLGLLLQNGDAPAVKQATAKPWTRDAEKTLGRGNKPTNSQTEALEMALNTPDIALIQGPPGTGKTSIIRALMVRIMEKDKKEQASILISSYQHDAVDNAVSGIDINGLPPYRVGGKRGGSQEKRESGMWDWINERKSHCEQVIQKQGTAKPTRKVTMEIMRLKDQWLQIRGGSESLTLLIKDICQLAAPYDVSDLLTKIQEVASRIAGEEFGVPKTQNSVENPSEFDSLLKRQRFSCEAFLDDGPDQARRLMRYLQRTGIEVPPSLKTAANSDISEMELESFLKEFENAIASLANPRSGNLHLEVNNSGDSLVEQLETHINELIQVIRQKGQTGNEAVAEIIQAFQDELDDPEAVRLMIKKYSGIIAGTCQQVVSSQVGLSDQIYDYVIIDEAARANPLDLLIPMSLGKRIILVGDHKQLPHELERDVIDNYLKDGDTKVVEFLKESLFERLFRMFSESHLRGSPKRAVTLQDDFRMHPVIGKFISDNFYEGKISSRCSSEERVHGLGMYRNKPICWLDLPIDRGAETDGISKSRPVEIGVISREVEQILNKNPKYTIGIITFYSRQAGLLQEEAEKLPTEWRDRILIGTVDAFQGREFDVVLLSTVRSNKQKDDLRKRLGFLTLSNRLCVAFSRARRLLVVVGDSSTVAGSGIEEIKELNAFYELCRKEGYYELR